MSDTKHTAGPWSISLKWEIGPRSTEDDQTNGMVIPIADVFGDNRSANARLIAAAPNLLAAVEWLEPYAQIQVRNHPGAPDTPHWRNLIAAIAKATGVA